MITMTKVQCLEMLDAFVKKNGRVPRMDEFINANGLPSKNTVVKYNGDILTLLRCRYPQYYINWDAKKIRLAVDIFLKERGCYPKVHDFVEKNNLPTIKEFEKYCGYIPEVLAEWYEDYLPRVHQWSKEQVIEAISRFVLKHNRLPKVNEFNRSNRLPGHKMVRDYCGTLSFLYEKYFPEYVPNKKLLNGWMHLFIKTNDCPK